MPKIEPHIVYSPLTNKVYLVINSQKKIECTVNFMRTIIRWMEQGNVLEPGFCIEKELTDTKGNILYKIELTAPKEIVKMDKPLFPHNEIPIL